MSSSGSSDEAASPSLAIVTSMQIYLPMLLVSVIAFELLRRPHPVAFACRRRAARTASTLSSASFGFLRWVLPVMKVSDDAIVELCGLDALVLLRFLRLGRKLACCGIILSIVLLPVYATADWTSSTLDMLDREGITGLKPGDPRLWASLLSMYVLSFYTMHLLLLLAEYKAFVRRRHAFLSKPDVQQYSVVINDLPRSLRTREALTKYLKYLFPTSLQAVVLSVECGHIEALVASRELFRMKLEHALAESATSGDRPLHIVKTRGTAVDAIEYFERKLKSRNEVIPIEIDAIEEKQRVLYAAMTDETLTDAACVSDHHYDDDDEDASRLRESLIEYHAEWTQPSQSTKQTRTLLKIMRHSAFVTFSSLQSAHIAQQLLQTETPTTMRVEAAPAPSDVVWENIGVSRQVRSTWQYVSVLVTTAIVVFWTIPTAIVASFAKVENLRQVWPSLDDAFAKHAWLLHAFQQFAPLGLVAMTAIAPVVFSLLSKREGHASTAAIDASLFIKLGYFQFIQIFFVSVFFGSFLTILDNIRAILDTSSFMSFLIIKTGLSLSLELLRVVPYLLSRLYLLCAPQLTRRERSMAWYGLRPLHEPGELQYAMLLPDYYQAVLLTLTFSPMSPLMAYFGALFFTLSEVVYRRQLLFVYDPNVHTTGAYWPHLYTFVMTALVVAQSTLLGVLSLKQAPGPATAALLLPVLTLLFHLHVVALYPRTAANLPLLECCRLDVLRSPGATFPTTTYVQPALLARPPLRADYAELGSARPRGEGIASESSSSSLVALYTDYEDKDM
ncbi:hypothetical protein SPRG_15855 [Saprolegnia parasitica CBS 223.65]|uniref:CSC1/OSCA1-like 7TM region domain-containing protein n=1 Tax=Saprolegnia parasitica (strain CBS 223.65) TaxID=695850 RepID=A0A067BX26_SAPPC|nr:hypothetical protein SPRG_15855 [Saprolegnia parasitica CBS 223.65]KDO18856.1 hypothetical protein SPRG_15855 [Saprolegnia parasitica CBS 223.65]|eukprot:XP_012210439.1 hypothetical protein SPRG_15855 [Saprolegnia parasitica CBS 223.65]